MWDGYLLQSKSMSNHFVWKMFESALCSKKIFKKEPLCSLAKKEKIASPLSKCRQGFCVWLSVCFRTWSIKSLSISKFCTSYLINVLISFLWIMECKKTHARWYSQLPINLVSWICGLTCLLCWTDLSMPIFGLPTYILCRSI